MSAAAHASKCVARAQELEDCARRIEEEGAPPNLSPRWRNASFLRREAAWWRLYALDLVGSAPRR
jgi:hypothetical protein